MRKHQRAFMESIVLLRYSPILASERVDGEWGLHHHAYAISPGGCRKVAMHVLVLFPDWAYPAVIDTTTGQVHYDNYNGAWGDQAELDRFLQIYAVERARIEARKKGHQVTEQALADGSIKLTIAVGGGS